MYPFKVIDLINYIIYIHYLTLSRVFNINASIGVGAIILAPPRPIILFSIGLPLQCGKLYIFSLRGFAP